MARWTRISTIDREGMPRLSDGPRKFPKSCVLYTHFWGSIERLVFAYLRHKEADFQDDIRRITDPVILAEKRGALHAIQGALVFMASTLPHDQSKSQPDQDWN